MIVQSLETARRRGPVRSGGLLLATVMALSAAAPALAQRGAVRGVIKDPDGNPLAGVQISIVLMDGGGRPIRVETNEKGEFIRAGLRVENYRVSFELERYEPVQAIVTVTNGGQAFIDEVMNPLPEGTLTQAEADRANAHLETGQSAFQDGDYGRAATEFRGYIALVPDSAAAYFNLAAALEQTDDHAGAIEAYEKAFELDSSMGQGLLAVADLHSRAQRWEEALAAFNRVLPLVEESALNLFNYAVSASNAGQDDLAAEYYGKATVVDPDFAPAFLYLGMAKVRQEDNEGAIAALERYLELDPDGEQAVTVHELLDSLRQQG